MKIGGIMKLTLLDYPQKVACTVFLEGCNFRCPFCHNSTMVECNSPDEVSEDELFAFLRKRQGILDGVCVSGGEPLISDEIFDFLAKIRDLGYSIKIDTNGSFPQRLKKIVSENLCDYVAMDIKNCGKKYAETSGCSAVSFEKILESIEFLKECGIPHHFRTTVVKDFHTSADVAEIAKLVGEDTYYIQPFRNGETVIEQSLSEFEREDIAELVCAAKEFAPNTKAIGIDL